MRAHRRDVGRAEAGLPVTTVAGLVPYLGGALALEGVAVTATRRRELMGCWCVWALGVPLVTAAFRLGPPGIAVLAAVVGVVAVAEFGGLLQLGPMDRAVLGGAIVGLVPTAWLAPEEVLWTAAAGALAIAVPLLSGDAVHGPRHPGRACCGSVGWASWPASYRPAPLASSCSW
ncbi:hypothetical protein ACWCQP_48880 [Streptomyces chartreusis]